MAYINRIRSSFFFFFSVLFFLYIHFPFYIDSIYSLHYVIVHLFLVLYTAFNYKVVLRLYHAMGNYKKFIHGAFLCWYFVVFMSFMSILIHLSYDFSYFKNLFRVIREIFHWLVPAIFIYRYFSHEKLWEIYMKLNILSCCLYIIISTIMLIMPELKNFWIGIIHHEPIDLPKIEYMQTHIFSEITRFGLKGYSGFSVSILCTFNVMLNLYLINRHRAGECTVPFYLYGSLIILLLGNMYYSRSGLIISISCILFNLFYILYQYRSWNMIFKILAGLIMIYFVIAILADTFIEVQIWLEWSWEPFIKFIESGTNGRGLDFGESGNDLMTLYFLPETKTIFWGDGHYTNLDGSYYGLTDVGILRAILFYGIFGGIMAYSIFFILVIGMVLFYKRAMINEGIIYLVMVLFSFIFCELKGEQFFYHVGFLFMVFILCIFDDLNKGKRDENKFDYD